LHEFSEFSGRRCAQLQDISFKAMVESVTSDYKELSFDAAYDQLTAIDKALVDIANVCPHAQKIIAENGLGDVTRPRTGMSAELGMYKRSLGKFHVCASCGSCFSKDYT
jgi:hypothetical protein